MMNWLRKIAGDTNEKPLRQIRPLVEKINQLEETFRALTDSELQAKTEEFRQRLHDGETTNDLLPEAFATVRETARRVIGQRHYDVQLIGGIVLHQGKIAEMRTGEGKTLVATLPLYLNALEGKGAHLITVNDYLAKVGAGWMGPIYHFLGLSVGFIAHDYSALYDPDYIDPKANQEDQRLIHWRACHRREAYAADITYGTNNEFGFDYLRDNMVLKLEDLSQRELFYAIVDEVDNILIDEARTPLIISGPAQKSGDQFKRVAAIVKPLKRSTVTEKEVKDGAVPDGDFMIEERTRSISLTDQGIERIEEMLQIPEGESLYDAQNYELTSYVDNALRAEFIYHRDKDYMVRDGEVLIVDEFTGRPMPGRRWSDGLHQAVEAKEGVRIRRENATMATITFQNYFRMYTKLAGMTGTAYTEREEFGKIYNLEVVVIPTNRPMVRDDMADQIYRSEEIKFNAVVRDVREMHEAGRPVLIGTTSVETSERLSELFKRAKIPHNVLNAKQHEREASVVTQAGRTSTVTIATNMAGRGTDILLGGNPDGLVEDILDERNVKLTEATPEEQQAALEEARKITEAERQRVLTLGGLHIIGTERHEARRIDNQLRGRAGRQGDPGSSQFYLSLEDELMRRFGRMEAVRKIMDRLGGEDLDLPIQHGMLDKAIESAQSRVEGFNFDIRKHTVEFDDVMNMQRQVIYADRRAILEGQSMRERVLEMIDEEVAALVDTHLPPDDTEVWDLQSLLRVTSNINPLLFPRLTINLLQQRSQEEICEQLDAMLDDEDMPERLAEMRGKEIEGLVERYLSGDDPTLWETEPLLRDLHEINTLFILKLAAVNLEGRSRDDIENLLLDMVEAAYKEREQAIGEEQMRYVERRMMLYAIDRQWIDYLTAMDELRQTISLQAYAQRNPLVEFKRQSFDMFDQLKEHITHDIVYQILPTSFKYEENLRQQQIEAEQRLAAAQRAGAAAEQSKASRTVRKVVKEPGRNDPCPCGSGKKYKHCHLGRFEEIAPLLLQQDGAPNGQQAVTPARATHAPQTLSVAVTGDNGMDEADTSGQKGRAVPRGRAAPPAASSSTATSGGNKQSAPKKGKRKQKR